MTVVDTHKTPPAPAPALAPEPQAPEQQLLVRDAPQADPTSKKPVVLATYPLEVFVIPGEDGADELRVTSAGLAVSKAQAKQVEAAAAAAGVRLQDITPAPDASEKD